MTIRPPSLISALASRVLSLAAATVTAALIPSVASATPVLPAPVFLSHLWLFGDLTPGNNLSFTAPGTYTLGGISTTVTGTSRPSLVGHVDGRYGEYRELQDDITYSFAVDGPVAGLVVPMFLGTEWHLSGTGGHVDEAASLRVDTPLSLNAILINARNNTYHSPAVFMPDFLGVLPFSTLSGGVNTLDMGIFIANLLNYGTASTGDASFDPYIFIDPVWLSSHPGYSVIVSAGIGNAAPGVPGVPEPGTLALFGAGLAGVAALRRRKTNS